MNKRFKVKLLAVFILAVLFGISVKLYAYSKALLIKPIEQQGTLGNNYEKYKGKKILLTAKEEELQGAWGVLKLTPFIFEPTTDFIIQQTYMKDLYDTFSSSSQWIFRDTSFVEIRSVFQKAGLDSVICDKLMANTTAATDGKGFITTPTDDVLWSLSAESRAKLYPQIGKYIENIMYSQPLYYGSSNSEEWLYNGGLREEIIEKLQKLIYVKDGMSYISDMHLILPLLTNDVERIKLLQLVYRTRALEVKLKIEEGQDVSQIAEYWSRFGNKNQIETMLEEVSDNRGGGEIDISKLLPQIPQSRLNTYSGLQEYETDYKDCHWTTINFFNREADERYYNAEDLLSVINGISEPAINSVPKFGDVISIFNENNELTHSCTYIADNIVLTKNGVGNLNPFVITFLDKTAPLYGDKTVFNSRTVGNTLAFD